MADRLAEQWREAVMRYGTLSREARERVQRAVYSPLNKPARRRQFFIETVDAVWRRMNCRESCCAKHTEEMRLKEFD